MGVTREQQAAYDSRVAGELLITQVAASGYSAVGTYFGLIGSFEAAHAGIAGASAATRFSIYTLPIAAFTLGAQIRQHIDDEDEKAHVARCVILKAGFQDAVDKHAKKFPNSKILDSSTGTGIKLLDDSKYGVVVTLFSTLHRQYWRDLKKAVESWRVSQIGPLAPTWEKFVRVQFNNVSRSYQNVLRMAEMVR